MGTISHAHGYHRVRTTRYISDSIVTRTMITLPG